MHEALKAYDTLAAEGIVVRIIDLYSVKPIDAETVKTPQKKCRGNLFVVEDHCPKAAWETQFLRLQESGVHPNVTRLAVRDMLTSGKPDEMLNAAGINAVHIVEAVGAG